uniref:Myosuppressin n=1 Tax=Daphnia galeata TaxID=27404 RepID=A0A8J2WC64_9CRUS|nr:unnamed protein product [Daphnia galeata]
MVKVFVANILESNVKNDVDWPSHGLVQSEKAHTASPSDQYHLFPTNCIKRFNRAGNEQVLATQDGRDHINENLHNSKMFATRGNHHTAAMMAVAAVLTFVVLVVVGAPSFAEAGSIPPPHCNPDVSDALPPRLRRICAALYGIAEISNAVEQYLDDKIRSRIAAMRDPMTDSDRGVKRQDVDHVFLRFGRR